MAVQYQEAIVTPTTLGESGSGETVFPASALDHPQANVVFFPGRLSELPPDRGAGLFPAVGRVHLVGIAGAGLRSLSEVLLRWGWKVSGSDLAPESAAELCAAGARIYRGHAAAHLSPRPDVVVYSDAVPPENPELTLARQWGLLTLSYFQALGRIMAGKAGVAVAGTHGKSTTTAMLAHVLTSAGLSPTVVAGAAPLGQVSGGRAGRGPLMLVEACEYRANFLHLRPRQAAILGIEPDHFDCYPSMEPLVDAFARFAALVPEDGRLLARHDCSFTRRAIAGVRCPVATFGLDPQADWSAGQLQHQRGRYDFDLLHNHKRVGHVCLQVPGQHNVLNALAAAALAWENGLSPQQIEAGLSEFPGLRQRLEHVGAWRRVTLLDDYAHHPTEVTASLTAVRQMYPGRRLWCVFQPHQASRTAALLSELAASLQNADKVIVADIFRAREPKPRPGEVTAADLAEAVRALGADVAEVHATEAILPWLKTHLNAEDVLITMGAGNIRKIHQHWKG
jgi:UDP-N-acetylmuramate--alanine ligase